METFHAFTLTHGLALGAIAALTAVAIALRRRRPAADPPGAAERAVGLAYLAAWVVTYTWLLFPPLHEPAKTFPLQLCHLCAFAAGLSLVTGRQWLRSIVHFWGLALCTQALVTPTLVEGPALYPFWFFWTTHGIIIGVAVYDIAARGYRPTLRAYGLACAATAAYAAIVLPLDILFGWNYGFLGPTKPHVPTIVDFLGPWPQLLGLIVLIVAGAMALLLVPWELARRLRTSARRKAHAGSRHAPAADRAA
jgi:hypothetical integral membrane protein (TIGR02206 family)